MKASDLLRLTGAHVVKRKGKRIVRVAPMCQAWAQRRDSQMLLQRAIRHPDATINLIEHSAPDELARLGAVFDSQLGGWIHPNGDEAAERVLLGIDAPPGRLPDPVAVPRVTRIEAELVSPGKFKWTEPPGVRVAVFYRGRRLA